MNASQRHLPREPREEEGIDRAQKFWQWFAVGMLIFCWLAEASMCGLRGF